MTPEEWQALSPEQRAENALHTDEIAAPATTGTTPPATPDAASQPGEAAADGGGTVEAPPVRGAAPVLPRLDGPSHRRPAERPETTGAPSGDPPTGASAPDRGAAATGAPQSSPAVASARTTVVAVEQLERMAAGSPADRSAAARRVERRAAERAAERRAGRRERRDTASQATDTRREAQVASGRTPVRADEAPAKPARTDDTGSLTAGAALLTLFAALTALLLHRPRPEASAVASAPVGALPAPDAAADPVEAELQAIIAEQKAARTPQGRPAQDAGTGDESSTATNSA